MKPTINVIIWALFGATCDAFLSPYELMILEEEMAIFNMDELPDYEVIPITISKVHKRSAADTNQKTISMRAFGENITLSCVENDGILAGKNTPIYSVRNEGKTITIQESQKVGDLKFYENITAEATFTVCKMNNRQQITGVIRSKRLAIHSLPEHIADKLMHHRRSLDNIVEDESDDNQYYLAIKIPESSTTMYNYDGRSKRRAHEIPNTIFPEVLIIVNYWLYIKFYEQMVPYVLSYWHAVDLMYRNLVGPEIRLNIAGILIAETEYGLSYMYENEVPGESDSYGLDINSAIQKMGEWLFSYRKNISMEKYDIAVTMTSNVLCRTSCRSDSISGLAYPNGACTLSERNRMTSRVAIILNTGAFEKIPSAAHELGHLLGAYHDEMYEECNPSTLMMTEFGGDRNSSDWSNCTLRAFKNFLRSNRSKCLHNKPKPGQVLPTVLPGTFMKADEQCKKLGHQGRCRRQPSPRTCVRLRCSNTVGKCVDAEEPAATGTYCGKGKVCFQNQCVVKNNL